MLTAQKKSNSLFPARCLAAAIFMLIVLGITSQSTSAATIPSTGTAGSWGRLSVKGTNIVGKNGKTVQLKGVSTHGIAWFPQYINKKQFASWKKMGANTIRLALYSSKSEGYTRKLYSQVYNGVKYATELGMYVIIDWHVLGEGNPNKSKQEALYFFTTMAKKYKKQTNIIYEICNEPNGNVTWLKNIKPYATTIINRIRKYDTKAIIIVGTPTWSQDVDIVSKSPIKNQKNIMYALHFYAATHKQYLRNKVTYALKKKLPIFVSEFSICDASGNGGINYTEAKKWMSLIKKYKIPFVSWNVSNKNETSSLIKSTCYKTGTITSSDLSATGKWLIKQF